MSITGLRLISVYVKKILAGDFIILLLYIDDVLIVRHDTLKIDMLKKELNEFFTMKDLGSTR